MEFSARMLPPIVVALVSLCLAVPMQALADAPIYEAPTSTTIGTCAYVFNTTSSGQHFPVTGFQPCMRTPSTLLYTSAANPPVADQYGTPISTVASATTAAGMTHGSVTVSLGAGEDYMFRGIRRYAPGELGTLEWTTMARPTWVLAPGGVYVPNPTPWSGSGWTASFPAVNQVHLEFDIAASYFEHDTYFLFSVTGGTEKTRDIVVKVPSQTEPGPDVCTPARPRATPGLVSSFTPWKPRTTRGGARSCHIGIDWEMPPRHNLFETPKTVAVARSRFYPPNWKVRLRVVDQYKLPHCPTDTTYQWIITAPGGASQTWPSKGCSVLAQVPKLGTYRVRVRELESSDHSPTGLEKTGDVVVQNLMLVGLGDSNASGEGNPPFFAPECARSVSSYQFQTAELLERADRHTSVSFIMLGCSGAETRHLWRDDYAGVAPIAGRVKMPQFQDVRRLLTPPPGVPRRKIHAAIVSIGVNDLLFGPILKLCLNVALRCDERDVRVVHDPISRKDSLVPDLKNGRALHLVLRSRIKSLPERFAAVESRLGQMGPMQAKRIVITEYPDFSNNQHGKTCGARNGPYYSSEIWKMLRSGGLNLNAQVRGTSIQPYGFKPVAGIAAAFKGHGYCAAGQAWIRWLAGAATKRNLSGPFHPTRRGHEASADRTIRVLCRQLYGNTGCDGTAYPKP